MNTKLLFFAISLSALLVACGDKDEVTNAPKNAPVEEPETVDNNNNNESAALNNPANPAFSFTHFELDVRYADNKSYEVSYENEVTGVEAKIEDDVNNKLIQGNEAMDTLTPIFQSLTFDASATNEEATKEILQKFNLPDNYQEFELEVKFSNDTVKEYKETK
jgi:predicted small lipoprotein YifL